MIEFDGKPTRKFLAVVGHVEAQRLWYAFCIKATSKTTRYLADADLMRGVVFYPAGATILPKASDSIFEPHNRFFIPHTRLRRADCVVGPCPSDFREKLIAAAKASIEIDADKRRTLLGIIGAA